MPHPGPSAGTSAQVARWAVPLARRVVETPLGPVLLAASDRGLAGLWFQGQRHDPTAAWLGLGPARGPAEPASHPVLRAAEAQLAAYFSSERPGQSAGHGRGLGVSPHTLFNLPLDLSHGTPFQRRVWQALCEIPAGQVWTYAALAARLGAPQAARAVGAAVGRNPVGVIVPCHRVVGAQGALTGYAGGLARKEALLRLEGALA